MSHSFFAYIFRMRYIARWALMRNTRTENVQEHSYEAAVLSHALAVIGRDVFHKELNPEAIAAAALFHDAPEIITGDMPTPIKYYNPSLKNAYKQVEAAAQDKLLSMLPEELVPAYAPLVRESGPVREGGGQAVGLHQVRGGGEGGERRVQKGGGADAGGVEGHGHGGAGLVYGAVPPGVQFDAG